jgi:hypothetical protein
VIGPLTDVEWWRCRWCGEPYRDPPAVRRLPVHETLGAYRSHLRSCLAYRRELKARAEATP